MCFAQGKRGYGIFLWCKYVKPVWSLVSTCWVHMGFTFHVIAHVKFMWFFWKCNYIFNLNIYLLKIQKKQRIYIHVKYYIILYKEYMLFNLMTNKYIMTMFAMTDHATLFVCCVYSCVKWTKRFEQKLPWFYCFSESLLEFNLICHKRACLLSEETAQPSGLLWDLDLNKSFVAIKGI